MEQIVSFLNNARQVSRIAGSVTEDLARQMGLPPIVGTVVSRVVRTGLDNVTGVGFGDITGISSRIATNWHQTNSGEFQED